jgi:CBS domain-containing protein
MLVRKIMKTDVRTAHPDSSIRDIAVTMCFNKISGLPVIDGEDRIIGIVSEKDILKRMYPRVDEFMELGRVDFEALEQEYHDLVNLKAEDLMSRNVRSVSPDDPIMRAVSVMCVNRIRRIPVAENGKLVGIVSLGDAHKAIFQEYLTRSMENRTDQQGEIPAGVVH